MTASAFSADGSVLAVVAGSKVTLWDPETSRLAAVLSLAPEHSMGPGASPVFRLLFIPGTQYLVGTSDTFIAVWNLLTASLHWAMDVAVSALAVDPVFGSFAIAIPAKAAAARTPSAAGYDPAAVAATTASLPAAGPSGSQQQAAVPDATNKATSSGRPAAPSSSTQQQWHPAARNKSHILVFDPRSPTPRFHSIVSGTTAPTLLYASPGMPQHAKELSDQVSPLMVLAENRAFTYITASGERGDLSWCL